MKKNYKKILGERRHVLNALSRGEDTDKMQRNRTSNLRYHGDKCQKKEAHYV